ncbi:MAG: SPFH domain-containing protein, partial [Saprospiraceae bacterium]
NRGVGKYEYKTGWVIINKWINKLYEFPTFQQSIEYPEQSVITKGGLSASIHPKFNYSLKAGDIGDMFSNLRIPVKDIEQGWLQNAIVGAVNDVANKWTIDDIFNNREQFEADIIKESNKRVSKWFIISQLRTNIIPPQSLQINIQEKTNAIQKVQIAENNKLVAIAQGLERIAKAQADSATAVITASGEARAIKIKQLSLNQEYIDYLKVQKWNGVSPTMVTSDKSGFIISPGKTN